VHLGIDLPPEFDPDLVCNGKKKIDNLRIELLAGSALDFGPGGFQILGGPVRAVVDNRVQGVGNGDELAPAAFSAETSGTSSDKQAR